LTLQLQVIAIILAVGFFYLTIYLIRKDHAEIRQMNKWLLLAIILIIGALFPSVGVVVAKLLGITTLTSLALYTLTAFLLVFSLISQLNEMKMERRIKRLTQEVSLLKKEINDLKEEKK
jgi:hypothetical protein